MNKQAVDQGIESLIEVKVPESWKNAQDEDRPIKDEPDFVKNIQRPMARHEGDELPVSAFVGMEDGSYPLGTTAYEKRGIAVYLPQWQPDKCIQCGQCSYVCPHATIRPFLLTDEELEKAPDTFITRKPKGKSRKPALAHTNIAPGLHRLRQLRRCLPGSGQGSYYGTCRTGN